MHREELNGDFGPSLSVILSSRCCASGEFSHDAHQQPQGSPVFPREMETEMRTAGLLAALGLVGVTAVPSVTAHKQRAPLLASVLQCRGVAEPTTRLACFDKSVAALGSAEASQDVIVIDQQQIRETRQSLFGISIPGGGLFGSGSDLPQIETTLANAFVARDGRWTFQLADGGRWVQTDDYTISRQPRLNDAVVIKRAALGSFRLSIGGQPAVKVRRLN